MKYSINKRAEKIVGKRYEGKDTECIIPFDTPEGLGYECPTCKKNARLEFSEYNGFMWCEKCDKDIPSPLCMPDIDKAIEIYLDILENHVKLGK